MEGVYIIQTIPQYEETWGWPSWLWYAVGFVAICVILMIILFIKKYHDLAAIPCSFLVVMAIVILSVASTATVVELPPRYQVVVSNSVTMTDFTERYIIIEQQGVSYIVEER